MKSIDIRRIILLMSIAVPGLILIQIYWVRNALRLEEQLFRQSVNKALVSTARQLEKKNALFIISDQLIKKEWDEDESVESYKIKINSQTLSGDKSIIESKEKIHYPGLNKDSTVFETKVIVQLGDTLENIKTITNLEKRKTLVKNWVVGAGHSKPFADILMSSDVTSGNKQLLFNKLMQDILSAEKPLDEWLNQKDVEDLLNATFSNHNIRLPFEFAVYQAPKSDKKLLSSTDFPKNQNESIHQTQLLYTNIFNDDPGVLAVHFPDQQSYLLKSIWLILVASLLLLLAVIFGFTYTIQTIFRQKKLSEMKTDFINNMTHELKTPISSIALAAEALQDNSIHKNEGLSQRFLKVIEAENKRLEGHVENVLQIAKLDKGDIKLNKTSVDVHEMIGKSIQSLSIQVEKKNGKITFTPHAKQPVITADKRHITNIIYNLLDNANKYSPKDPDITIATADETHGLLISVEDKGIGMDEATQRKIFEKFYRVSTGNVHDVKGFGLGLSYVKTMVNAHNGHIGVKSSPGKGSKFEIFLPYG